MFEHFINILTNPPGTLFFHLVLIFSLAIFLQAAMALAQFMSQGKSQRMIIGIFILLLMQIALFFLSAFAWQGVSNTGYLMPAFDRGFTTLSFIWIIWMWVFPIKNRSIDFVTLFISLAVITLIVFSIRAWNIQQSVTAFNSTLLDWAWSVFYLIILVSGILLVLVRRPTAWGLALFFLNANLFGALAHMLWASPGSDYSIALRISQLCTFPLLPVLIYRLSEKPIFTTIPEQESPGNHILPAAEWLEIAAQKSMAELLQLTTQKIVLDVKAHACIWLSAEPEFLLIEAGYHQPPANKLSGFSLKQLDFPAIQKAFSKTHPTLIENNPLTRQEMNLLNQTTGMIGQLDCLYVHPVIKAGKKLGAFLLTFLAQEEMDLSYITEYLTGLQDFILYNHDNFEGLEKLRGKAEAIERELTAARHQLSRQQNEIKHLQGDTEKFASIQALQEDSSNQIAQLESENEQLQSQLTDLRTNASVLKPDQPDIETDISLLHLIDRTIAVISSVLMEKNITLNIDVPDGLPEFPSTHFKRKYLQILLQLLFEHASDASTENGSITIKVFSVSDPVMQIVLLMGISLKNSYAHYYDAPVTLNDKLVSTLMNNVEGNLIQAIEGNFQRIKLVLDVDP